MRIGLFIPCYIDAFFPEVGIATLELLERLGHEVVYPRDQTCCGQPMANSGFNAECADTEALFVRNFSGFDHVAAPSGSCVHHRVGLHNSCGTMPGVGTRRRWPRRPRCGRRIAVAPRRLSRRDRRGRCAPAHLPRFVIYHGLKLR